MAVISKLRYRVIFEVDLPVEVSKPTFKSAGEVLAKVDLGELEVSRVSVEALSHSVHAEDG